MASNRFPESSRPRANDENFREIKSSKQIILGWDTFNSITFLILIVLFTGWCLTYFITYIPKEEHNVQNNSSGGGHGDHSAHGHDRDRSSFNVQRVLMLISEEERKGKKKRTYDLLQNVHMVVNRFIEINKIELYIMD
ncbi:high affinity copper uptake protein 1-like [Vespula squamosa]|uniref:High affinity copper uptake protein 1-like n=1 Tax=Vespula squamosa TaxID=30214 RepID=A0ABD2B2C6_VESSQ